MTEAVLRKGGHSFEVMGMTRLCNEGPAQIRSSNAVFLRSRHLARTDAGPPSPQLSAKHRNEGL